MTRRPGTRGLRGWELEAFAAEVPHGAECAPEQLELPIVKEGAQRPAPSPLAQFTREARAIADRARGRPA
jgi:hypothetical protein